MIIVVGVRCSVTVTVSEGRLRHGHVKLRASRCQCPASDRPGRLGPRRILMLVTNGKFATFGLQVNLSLS